MRRSRTSEPCPKAFDAQSSPDPKFWIFSKSVTQPPNFLQPVQTEDKVHLDSVANTIDLSAKLKDKALSIFSDIESAQLKTFNLCSQLMLFRSIKYLSYLILGLIMLYNYTYSLAGLYNLSTFLTSLTFPYISLLFFGITTISKMAGPISAPFLLGTCILDYLFSILSILSLSGTYSELVYMVYFLPPLVTSNLSAWICSVVMKHSKNSVGSFKKRWAFFGLMVSTFVVLIISWLTTKSPWNILAVVAYMTGSMSTVFLIYYDSVTYYSLLPVVEYDDIMKQMGLMEFLAVGMRQNIPLD